MLTLELDDQCGTLGVRERDWVVRRKGLVLGRCDERDDPTNPTFWVIPGLEFDESRIQRHNLADFFRFAQRL